MTLSTGRAKQFKNPLKHLEHGPKSASISYSSCDFQNKNRLNNLATMIIKVAIEIDPKLSNDLMQAYLNTFSGPSKSCLPSC